MRRLTLTFASPPRCLFHSFFTGPAAAQAAPSIQFFMPNEVIAEP